MLYNIQIPNEASVHILRSFLSRNLFFSEDATEFEIAFHPRFVYLQPFALAMLAAWGYDCRQRQIPIRCPNVDTSYVDYAWRMGLFGELGIAYEPKRHIHEEAGRFIPLRRITRGSDVQAFLADVAPLLHRPEHIQAVQYCFSELIRNVLEHAGGAPAFACAQYYHAPRRVSIGVADCGIGLLKSLRRAFNIAEDSDAILEALTPGVTGSPPQMYGSPDNAGVGLFFTKSIAKASGEYFAIFSGTSAFRLRRRRHREQLRLFVDPRADRHDIYQGLPNWHGTVVAVDIGVRQERGFDQTMAAIREAISADKQPADDVRVKFT
ncbi:MAG TPA: hypothetical protein VGR36_04260 [Candidatus Acidoferrales bacterium]|nr:hypothetical protein [Candidatus Acidoferrales bacterium]